MYSRTQDNGYPSYHSQLRFCRFVPALVETVSTEETDSERRGYARHNQEASFSYTDVVLTCFLLLALRTLRTL